MPPTPTTWSGTIASFLVFLLQPLPSHLAPGCSQVTRSSTLHSCCPHCFGSLAGSHCLPLMAFHYLAPVWFLCGVVQITRHGLLFQIHPLLQRPAARLSSCLSSSIKYQTPHQKPPLVPWTRGGLQDPDHWALSHLSFPVTLIVSVGHWGICQLSTVSWCPRRASQTGQ